MAQKYNVAVAAGHLVGLRQISEAVYGVDILTLEAVDWAHKTAEAFGRLGGTAAAGAGGVGFLRSRLQAPKAGSFPDVAAPCTFPTRPGGTGAAYNELTGQGVYILRDSSGKIRYVGRGDAPERLIAHSRLGSGKDDLVGEILFNNNLPAAQAKSLEQELMQMLGGARSVNPSTSLRNKIQGIGEGNPNFLDLEFAADHELVIEALRRAGLLGR